LNSACAAEPITLDADGLGVGLGVGVGLLVVELVVTMVVTPRASDQGTTGTKRILGIISASLDRRRPTPPPDRP